MAIGIQPIFPSTSGIVEFLGAGVNPAKLGRTGNPSAVPNFEKVMLAQLLSNGTTNLFSILLGDDENKDESVFGGLLAGVSPGGTNSLANSSIFGQSLGSALLPGSIPGVSGITDATLQLFSTANRMIGKNVTTTHPTTGNTVTGSVQSVVQDNGRIFLNVNVPGSGEIKVRAETIQKISQP